MVRGANFTSGFYIDIDEIMQIGCFRFMEEIAGNGHDFVLYALFDREPI